MNYNKVILMGRLTRDVELRFTKSNTAIADIGLAVNRKYKTADGESGEETLFVDCTAWGKSAETLGQYSKKGDVLLIEGRLKLEQWTSQDGQKRSKIGVTIEQFQFVGGGKKASAGPARRQQETGGGGLLSEEDIPFSM